MDKLFSLTDTSGYGNVEGSGEFNVLTVSFHHGNRTAEAFHHTGIIREALFIGLIESTAEQSNVECLGSLDNPVVASEYVATLTGIIDKP